MVTLGVLSWSLKVAMGVVGRTFTEARTPDPYKRRPGSSFEEPGQ